MLPARSAHQPNHKRKVPMTCSGVEWPSKSEGRSHRPSRGPRMAAPTAAAQPPVMCTTPEPANEATPQKGRQAEREGTE